MQERKLDDRAPSRMWKCEEMEKESTKCMELLDDAEGKVWDGENLTKAWKGTKEYIEYTT